MTGPVIRGLFALSASSFQLQTRAPANSLTTPVSPSPYRQSYAHITIAAAASSIRVGPPVSFENVVMFPLVSRDAAQRRVSDYRTLDEGLKVGVVEI